MVTVDSAPEFAQRVYDGMERNLQIVRDRLRRPMSLAEKIIFSHLDDPHGQQMVPGETYVQLRPDRVILQDVLGQTAMLQFMQTRRDRTAVPTSIHCDHLIQARTEGVSDLRESLEENREVYEFPAVRVRQVWRRLLGTRRRHHPSGCAGKLRVPRRDHDRHRTPTHPTEEALARAPLGLVERTRSR